MAARAGDELPPTFTPPDEIIAYGSGKSYDIEDSEVDRMFAALESKYPDVRAVWRANYVKKVMAMPSKTNVEEPRSFGYAKGKLLKVLEYRQEAIVPLTLEKMIALDTELNGSKWIYMSGFDKVQEAKGKKIPIMYVHSSEIPWSRVDAEKLVDITIFWLKCAFEEHGCEQFSAVLYGPDISMSTVWYASSYVKSLSGRFVKGFPDRLCSLCSCPTTRLGMMLFEVAKLVLPTPVVNKLLMIGSQEEEDKMKKLTDIVGAEAMPTFYGGPCDHSEVRGAGIAAQIKMMFGSDSDSDGAAAES
jgi:hypothetical protein